MNYLKKKGFTLIELLVVVIIIAVLAAVAMPMYKRAVLKSRFSTVMPMAKAVADAQEVYYLGNGQYALDKAELDITPMEANNTTVALSPTDGYDYVLAQRSDVPEVHYVMYQKHSENYPGEIHCEAQDENDMATYLCQSIGGTQDIGKTITDGYTTYIISGTGAGLPAGADDDNNDDGCASATALGLTCSITTDANGKEVKQLCKGGYCRYKTYDGEGGYTSVTCNANAEGVCTDNVRVATYDSHGNKTSTRTCSTVEADGTCSAYSWGSDYKYDANGNQLSSRVCKTITPAGVCTEYKSGNDYTYDANGHQLTVRMCGTVANDGTCTAYSGQGGNNTYDTYGNATSNVQCTLNEDGTCNTYLWGYYYTYDGPGKVTSQSYCASANIAANGTCTSYNSNPMVYNYDANGNLISARACRTLAADGSCSAYSTGYTNSGYDYTYDANGNKTSELRCLYSKQNGTCETYAADDSHHYTYDTNGNKATDTKCETFNANGSCATYKSVTAYTYDTNGNQTSSRNCGTIAADGSCSSYKNGAEYAYDANGNRILQRSCTTNADGTCVTYTYANVNTYDEDNKQIVWLSCSGSNINPNTGECLAYDDTSVYSN